MPDRILSPAGRGADAGLEVRAAVLDDFPSIATIYAHHVLHGLGTFETVPPEPGEMVARWRAVDAAGLPWLVANIGGRVAGYACARPWNPRAAYRHSVEDSVYVARAMQGQGVGRALLQALITDCEARRLHRMLAQIGDRDNAASIRLHAGMGFKRVGILEEVGHKFERWVDVVIMQRALEGGD